MSNWLNLIPLLIIFIASLAMIVFDDWRRNIIALALLYLGIFILLVQVMPLTLSAVKLITGWMSALLLGLALPREKIIPQTDVISNRIFRLFSLILIWVIAFLISKSVSSVFQIKQEIAFASLAVFGTGLLQLGMKFHYLFIILGILTVFAGFELLYASVETSVLINGLLSVINLLIALIGSFLVDNSQQEGQS